MDPVSRELPESGFPFFDLLNELLTSDSTLFGFTEIQQDSQILLLIDLSPAGPLGHWAIGAF